MKKILLILLLLVNVYGAKINWMNDIDDAYDVAEKEHKIVFVILSQVGCPACNYMKDVVLKNKDVIKEFNKGFIGVHLDIHHDSVPLELEHFVTPTLYFLSADEKILHRINGYKNDTEFIDELDTVQMLKD
jgi:thioredoxin-related protein